MPEKLMFMKVPKLVAHSLQMERSGIEKSKKRQRRSNEQLIEHAAEPLQSKVELGASDGVSMKEEESIKGEKLVHTKISKKVEQSVEMQKKRKTKLISTEVSEQVTQLVEMPETRNEDSYEQLTEHGAELEKSSASLGESKKRKRRVTEANQGADAVLVQEDESRMSEELVFNVVSEQVLQPLATSKTMETSMLTEAPDEFSQPVETEKKRKKSSKKELIACGAQPVHPIVELGMTKKKKKKRIIEAVPKSDAVRADDSELREEFMSNGVHEQVAQPPEMSMRIDKSMSEVVQPIETEKKRKKSADEEFAQRGVELAHPLVNPGNSKKKKRSRIEAGQESDVVRDDESGNWEKPMFNVVPKNIGQPTEISIKIEKKSLADKPLYPGVESVKEIVSLDESTERKKVAIKESSKEKKTKESLSFDGLEKRKGVASQQAIDIDGELTTERVNLGDSMGGKEIDSVLEGSRSKKRKNSKRVRFQNSAEDNLEENGQRVRECTKMDVHGENVTTDSEGTKQDVCDENDTTICEDLDPDVNYYSTKRSWQLDFENDDLIYGKYFTKEEDQKIKEAVYNYIKYRNWNTDVGLDLVLRSAQTEARGCWLDIARCLPHRPVKQIYTRAYRLLGNFKNGKWSKEEGETLKSLIAEHGSDWKKIGTLMDRFPQFCKDKWRRLKNGAASIKGPFSQDEFDKLSKLVRMSLKIRASEPQKKRDRRLLRDDIHWDWIGREMCRSCEICSVVWYEKLASPMIVRNQWANGDDRLFLQSLMASGATSEEALDWDQVLDHRSGETCIERWAEMTKLLGPNRNVSFEEKVEILAKRYTPDLLGMDGEEDQ